jgi:hypothetical protein
MQSRYVLVPVTTAIPEAGCDIRISRCFCGPQLGTRRRHRSRSQVRGEACEPLASVARFVHAPAACTTTDVSPVPASGYPIAQLCIERNPEVVVRPAGGDRAGVARHGITARRRRARARGLRLRALVHRAASLDFRPRLGYVELRVRFRGETIGTATWISEPSLSPFKWRSTETNIGPVVDELLGQFPQ